MISRDEMRKLSDAHDTVQICECIGDVESIVKNAATNGLYCTDLYVSPDVASLIIDNLKLRNFEIVEYARVPDYWAIHVRW